jgi:hypothetical protein
MLSEEASNMMDLSTKSPKTYAKLGLAVTLFAFLAACSSKKIEGDEANNMNPIPANEMAAAESTPTPFPQDDASKASTAPAPAPRATKRFHIKRKTRIVHHKAHKKNVSAVAQVTSKTLPPPPAPPVEMTPTSAQTGMMALPPPPPVPTELVSNADETSGHRGWMIGALLVILAAASIIGYRVNQKRKPRRRLVFNG